MLGTYAPRCTDVVACHLEVIDTPSRNTHHGPLCFFAVFWRGLEVGAADLTMMRGGMMFGEVVGEVFGSWRPVNDELLLLDAIFDPVETHVHGSGAALFHRVVDDAGCCGVVGFDWRGWLRVAELFERGAHGGGFGAVEEERADFGFGGGAHDVLELAADGVQWSVVWWRSSWCAVDVAGLAAEVEVAAGAAAGLGQAEVRGVAVHVQNHVAAAVHDRGVGVRGAVVQ